MAPQACGSRLSRPTQQRNLKITPTPVTAELTGFFSALVLPFVWSRYADSASSASIELLAAFLLLVALPAHAFVMGFGRNQMATRGR